MQKKEIYEIRRIIKPDQSRLDTIYSCYINAEKNIIFKDVLPFGLLKQSEKDLYTDILKKSLSGRLEQNLLKLEFERPFDDNKNQELFYRISKDNEEDDVDRLIELIRTNYETDGNYAIILGHGVYDVVEKKSDQTYQTDSDETYSFILLAICPTANPKGALVYDSQERKFSENDKASKVKNPDFGLLYPSFTNREANIYDCLYYVKNNSKRDEDFERAVLNCTMPDKVDSQQDYYKALVDESLDDKNIEKLSRLNQKLKEMAEASKESDEPIRLTGERINDLLESIGGKKVEVEGSLLAENLAAKDYRLISDNGIKITIPEEEIYAIREEKIGGQSYILVPADGMDLNGIKLSKS